MAVKLEAKGIEKRYRRFTLKVDNLVLEEGIHVVIGPNGSGKTVLLKTITGLLRPNKGSVTLESPSGVYRGREVLKRASLVLTDIELPNWSVRELLEAYLHLTHGEAERLAGEFLLHGFLDKKYLELSSGYRKRVQTAIALNTEADLLVLDEPFINVDSQYVGFLEERILGMKGKIVVVASHVPTRLFEHDIIMLKNGRIMFRGVKPGLLEDLVEVTSEGRTIPISKLLEQCGIKGSITIRPIHEIIEINREEVSAS